MNALLRSRTSQSILSLPIAGGASFWSPAAGLSAVGAGSTCASALLTFVGGAVALRLQAGARAPTCWSTTSISSSSF